MASLHDTNGRCDWLAERDAGSMNELLPVLERVRLISGIRSTDTSLHLASLR